MRLFLRNQDGPTASTAAALFRLEKSRDLEVLRQQVSWMAAGPELGDGLLASVYTLADEGVAGEKRLPKLWPRKRPPPAPMGGRVGLT